MPFGTVIDMTPGGRSSDGYPKQEYETVLREPWRAMHVSMHVPPICSRQWALDA